MNEDKKRVLIIAANDMGKSGVPSVYMSIVRNLSDQYIFDIVITRENYFYGEEFLKYGGKIYLIKDKDYKNKIKRIWWRLFNKNRFIRKELQKSLSNNRYEILHSFKESESSVFFKYGIKQGIKKRILHINRVYESYNNPLIKVYSHIQRTQSIKYATHLISVSQQSGKSYFHSKSFQVIPNTYDEKKYHYMENNHKDLVLLQIGTFLPIKNQLFTIEVFSHIAKEIPNAKLHLIGNPFDDGYYKKCIDKIRKAKLENNIIIKDSSFDQGEILNFISYALLPSLKEGFSLFAVEMQACGIPVFASNGVPKDVDAGGLFYMDLDIYKWKEAILNEFYISKNRRLKYDMENFSNIKYHSNYINLYK